MKKLFRRADVIVIVCVLLISFLLFVPNFFNKDELIAQIYVDGEIADEINLDKVENEYTVSPKEDIEIRIANGEIGFTHAPCRDKLCIRSGTLTSKGQTAACLPEKVVVIIKGADKTDMITY